MIFSLVSVKKLLVSAVIYDGDCQFMQRIDLAAENFSIQGR